MIPLALLATLAVQAPAAPRPVVPSVDLCTVRVRDRAELERLRATALDADDHGRIVDGRVRVYADAAEEARLRSLGFELAVVQPDLSAFYARRAAAEPRLTQGGSMGGFKTLAEIGAEMDRLAATYPSIVSPKFSIGTSLEGRPIWAMRVSDHPTIDEPGEPVAELDAIHHAREPMGGEALLLFVDELCTRYATDPVAKRIVDTRCLFVIPCVNPDGYEYNRQTNPSGGGMWRKNRRPNGDGTFGVDLNRNYGWEWGPQWQGSSSTTNAEDYRGPSAFSEPETRVIRDFLTAHPPGMELSAHTYSNLWLFPWGYDFVHTGDDAQYRYYGQRATAQNGWPSGQPPEILYVANGVSVDWLYGTLGTFAFSPEIGSDSDGFWPVPSRITPLYQSVRPDLYLIAKWCGGWAERSTVSFAQVTGNGDAVIDPGETWALTVGVTNPGVLPVSGTMHLASSSPYVTVVQADASFSSGAQVFASTQPTGPMHLRTARPLGLEIAIAPDAPPGNYVLDLAMTWDGDTTPDTVPVAVGTPRRLAIDDMEISNFGWQVTSTGANYAFQRAVPQQTGAQPGNDDPLGTGTMCWVTGAAAGSGDGTNDVDGTTTLTSPVFRASGFTHLELDYARWFADLPGGPLDDVLLVQVSNDGGTSWTTLETTPNANSWQTKSFDLESFVTLSDAMKIRFTASDSPNNDLCEALVDDVVLKTFSTLPTLGEWGATSAAATARLFVDGPPSVAWKVKMSTSAGSGTTTSGTAGLFYLTGTIQDVATGTTDVAGRAALPWTVPSGTTLYLQVLLDEGGAQAAWSNLLTVVVQ